MTNRHDINMTNGGGRFPPLKNRIEEIYVGERTFDVSCDIKKRATLKNII